MPFIIIPQIIKMFSKLISKTTRARTYSGFARIQSFEDPKSANKHLKEISFIKYREGITQKYNLASTDKRDQLLLFFRAQSWNDVNGAFRRLNAQEIELFKEMEDFVSKTIEQASEKNTDENFHGFLAFCILIGAGWMMYNLSLSERSKDCVEFDD